MTVQKTERTTKDKNSEMQKAFRSKPQAASCKAAPKNIKLFLSECGLLIAWKTEKVVGRLN